jgi:hypothetical protein
MRLNWFSALPPAAGEPAAYTERLLPLLGKQVEVTLWTSQPDWSRELEAWATVRRFQPGDVPWTDLNQADATIYQLDSENVDLSRRHPGIVVLSGDDVPVERALAVVVHDRAVFERHKAEARWPVVYAPEGGEECVAVLRRLAGEVGRCQAQLLALELARRAAGELAGWTNPATCQAELRQVAQAIHDLTVGAAQRTPLAA